MIDPEDAKKRIEFKSKQVARVKKALGLTPAKEVKKTDEPFEDAQPSPTRYFTEQIINRAAV